VAERGLDDRGELRVLLAPEPDVAGIDAVFRQRLGAGRLRGEQLVPVVVEVADQRHRRTEQREPVADPRHGGRRLGGVHRHAHELGAGAGELGALLHRAEHVGRVGVGHGLHDDRMTAADGDPADDDRAARAPFAQDPFGHSARISDTPGVPDSSTSNISRGASASITAVGGASSR
jgi:hypothetical protein